MVAAGWRERPGEKHDRGPDLPWREAAKASRTIKVWSSGRFSYRVCQRATNSSTLVRMEESPMYWRTVTIPVFLWTERNLVRIRCWALSSLLRALPRIGSSCIPYSICGLIKDTNIFRHTVAPCPRPWHPRRPKKKPDCTVFATRRSTWRRLLMPR